MTYPGRFHEKEMAIIKRMIHKVGMKPSAVRFDGVGKVAGKVVTDYEVWAELRYPADGFTVTRRIEEWPTEADLRVLRSEMLKEFTERKAKAGRLSRAEREMGR